METYCGDFLKFVEDSPTAFHTADSCRKKLLEAGFLALDFSNIWRLKAGGKYFIIEQDSLVVAFVIPEKAKEIGFRLVASHGDSPGFKLKPNFLSLKENYNRLGCEVYGSPILETWTDRPLAIAGRVFVEKEDDLPSQTKKPDISFTEKGILKEGTIESRLVNFIQERVIIPSIPSHLNQTPGGKMDLNKDMIPLLGLSENIQKELGETINFTSWQQYLGWWMGIEPDKIYQHDLFLYNADPGMVWGGESLISAPRMDNLAGVFSTLTGFIRASSKIETLKNIAIFTVFDHEEVGSSTRKGAGSSLLHQILQRIQIGLNQTPEESFTQLNNSFFLSVDNAHAIHPNYPELSDENHKIYLNKGIVIKHSANQSYITDGFSLSWIQALCQKQNLPYQIFTNRSDIRGGSTLGHFTNMWIPFPGADIGIPQLSMHASLETVGKADLSAMGEFIYSYFLA